MVEKQKIKEGKNIKEKIGAGDLKKNDLTFLDGVMLTAKIYNQVLKKRLTNEKGELEKDEHGADYLGIIEDDINDILHDEVLMPYFNDHGSQLANELGINL